jgi:hypothetical protein
MGRSIGERLYPCRAKEWETVPANWRKAVSLQSKGIGDSPSAAIGHLLLHVSGTAWHTRNKFTKRSSGVRQMVTTHTCPPFPALKMTKHGGGVPELLQYVFISCIV